ncbi:Fic family protein [Thalassotalea euphylliae]|nr:Fic family protein [Thalassotalea euphylliae]
MSSTNNSVPEKTEALYQGFINMLVEGKVSDVSDLITQILNKRNNMDLSEKISQVDTLKKWLDSFRPLSYEIVEELKKQYDVKFTYNSNAIEGNTLTQSETELVIEKGITVGGKQLSEHLEAIGHKEAIDYIESLSRKEQPITLREIKDIHNVIMRGISIEEAGRYRQLDVRAAGTGHTYPAHFLVSGLMDEFVDWMNSQEAKSLHPLKLATEVHYRFVSIHPFKDGNGRTARLLMNLSLLRSGYPIVIIDNQKRSEYINSLVFAQDNHDNTDELFGMILDGSEESLIDYLKISSTAAASQGKGELFYEEVQNYLDKLTVSEK